MTMPEDDPNTGTHEATAVPQASPKFAPDASVLLAANQYSGVGLGTSDSTLSVANPYGKSMRDTLKQSGGKTV